MADCPRLFPSISLMPQAYAYSSQFRIGIYDCLYIALAEEEQCGIVSDDSRLASLLPKLVIPLATI
jgi:predicted nucleic acid-binding protein